MLRRAKAIDPLFLALAAVLALGLVGAGCRKSADEPGAAHGRGRERTLPDNVELSRIEGVSIIQCPARDYPSVSIEGDASCSQGEAETAPLPRIIHAWCDFSGWLIIEADLPDARYNVKVTAEEGRSLWPLAKKAFEEVFALRFNEGKEILDVLVLQKAEDPPPGLTRVETTSTNWGTAQTDGGFGYEIRAGTMQTLIRIISDYVAVPVIDETGITGFYNFTLAMHHWKPETLFPGVERLGLKLEKARRELDVMRVVAAPHEPPASLPPDTRPR